MISNSNFIICPFSAFAMKPIVEQKILEKFPLEEGSQMFIGWKEPPATPISFIMIFNLTNEEEFLQGKDKSI